MSDDPSRQYRLNHRWGHFVFFVQGNDEKGMQPLLWQSSCENNSWRHELEDGLLVAGYQQEPAARLAEA